MLAGILALLFIQGRPVMAQEPMFSSPTIQLIGSLSRSDPAGASGALAAGANVNERGPKGITPLIDAVIRQNGAVVSGLLGLQADPNLRQLDGHNALTAAYEVSRSAPSILDALIRSRKCDLNALMPDGEPLLFYLAAGDRLDFLRLALAHGADPSLRTRGERPLVIEAAMVEAYDAVQLLLDAGASPQATDHAGKALLDFVQKGASQKVDPQGQTNQARLRLLQRLLRSQAT